MPLISPVAVLIVRPTGSAPSVTANVIGDLPPETFSGSEYGVPVIPSRSEDGVVIAVGTTIWSLTSDVLLAVPELFVAVAVTLKKRPISFAEGK